jgi:hypothetical protein
VTSFLARYLRWSVMQRKAVGNAAYATQILLNPVAFATAALLASPGRWTALGFCVVALVRSGLCEYSARALRGRGFSALCLFAPLGDVLVAGAWAAALVRSRIEWRGNRLAVRGGTRLEQVPSGHRSWRILTREKRACVPSLSRPVQVTSTAPADSAASLG